MQWTHSENHKTEFINNECDTAKKLSQIIYCCNKNREFTVLLILNYMFSSTLHSCLMQIRAICAYNFLFKVLCIIRLYYSNQWDATISSQYLFISLQYYSTCFRCSQHPSSGVQDTVVHSHWYRSYIPVNKASSKVKTVKKYPLAG
jgi:hypothetical protein